MRKRRFVCGIALCLALSVAGCGKSSEEKQAAKYYQDELGLDKEDADALAHELYGKDEEAPGVPEGGSQEVPQKSEVEPLPELVNSEWYDQKGQIYDMIFCFDQCYCMTEEDIRRIVDGSAYDVELQEGFDENGEVRLQYLMVNGEHVAQLQKGNPNHYLDLGEYEWFDDGDYYRVSCLSDTPGRRYDKASIEFENLKTRDDVLAYLAENGFVEVEKNQSPYAYESVSSSRGAILPNEFTDAPHYYCKGAQSITFYRIHKLDETDEVIEGRYSGAHLNLVNCVTFKFNTDGTVDVPTNLDSIPYYAYWEVANPYGGDYPGWYLPGVYTLDHFTWKVMVVGEQIN